MPRRRDRDPVLSSIRGCVSLLVKGAKKVSDEAEKIMEFDRNQSYQSESGLNVTSGLFSSGRELTFCPSLPRPVLVLYMLIPKQDCLRLPDRIDQGDGEGDSESSTTHEQCCRPNERPQDRYAIAKKRPMTCISQKRLIYMGNVVGQKSDLKKSCIPS